MVRGSGLLAKHDLGGAREAFQKAIKLSSGKCFSCFEMLAAAETGLGKYGAAIDSARSAIEVASNDLERARGWIQFGLAKAGKAGKNPKDSALLDAEGAFRKALELQDGLSATRFHLAGVLIRRGADAEADAVLDDYLNRAPDGSLAKEARALRKNHRRATEACLPVIRWTALDGKTITLETLEGKVVLLDFWATWCAPCRESIPELKNLRRLFSADAVEIISISVDKDRHILEEFVQKNGMAWTQVFDEGFRISREFGVNVFPTYVLVTADGLILRHESGYSSLGGFHLRRQIEQAMKKRPAR